jgi:hypothetical protein
MIYPATGCQSGRVEAPAHPANRESGTISTISTISTHSTGETAAERDEGTTEEDEPRWKSTSTWTAKGKEKEKEKEKEKGKEGELDGTERIMQGQPVTTQGH